MMRTPLVGLTILVLGTAAVAGREQLGQIGKIGSAVKKASDVRDLQMTDAEEQQLGQAVSAKIRERYGVVQDAAPRQHSRGRDNDARAAHIVEAF